MEDQKHQQWKQNVSAFSVSVFHGALAELEIALARERN